MNVSPQKTETSTVAQGQHLPAEARLIIGVFNDPGFVPATGGPGESYGNPDPVASAVPASGGTGAALGTPDPVSAFIAASGFHDMRLIGEPIGISPFTTGTVGASLQQALSTPGAAIALALDQARLDRFVGAMAGFVAHEAGTMSPLLSYSEIEPARVQIAASLAHD